MNLQDLFFVIKQGTTININIVDEFNKKVNGLKLVNFKIFSFKLNI